MIGGIKLGLEAIWPLVSNFAERKSFQFELPTKTSRSDPINLFFIRVGCFIVPVVAFAVLFNLPKFFEVTFRSRVRQVKLQQKKGFPYIYLPILSGESLFAGPRFWRRGRDGIGRRGKCIGPKIPEISFGDKREWDAAAPSNY